MTERFVGSQGITSTRPSSRCRLRSKSYFWWRWSDTFQGVASQRREDFVETRFLCWFQFSFTGSISTSFLTRRSAFVTYCLYSHWLQFFAEDFYLPPSPSLDILRL